MFVQTNLGITCAEHAIGESENGMKLRKQENETTAPPTCFFRLAKRRHETSDAAPREELIDDHQPTSRALEGVRLRGREEKKAKMDVFVELLKKFFKENAGLLALFLLISLILNPLETILIPDKAGKLAGQIKNDLPTNDKKKHTTISKIRKQIYTLLGLYVVAMCMHTGLNLTMASLVPRFREMARNEIYERMIKRSEENFDDIPSGKVMFRIQRISNAMADFTYYILGNILPLLILMASVCIYMAKVNGKLGIACIVLIVGFFMAFFAFSKTVVDVSSQVEAMHEQTVDTWQNRMSNMMNIVVTNSTAQEAQESAKTQHQDAEATQKKMRTESTFRTVFSGFGIGLFSILALLSFSEYKKRKLPGSKFASVGIVALMVSNMLTSIANKSPKYLSDMGLIQNSAKFMRSLWSTSVNVSEEDLDDLPANEAIKGHVEFRNISFSYPPSALLGEHEETTTAATAAGGVHRVLNDFSLTIQPGEKVAIFGTSGSGKTTVAKLLLGLKKPQEGAILLDGVDLSTAKRSHIRRAISMSNQQLTLFNGTIVQNIRYGLRDAYTESDIERVLEKYELTGVFSKLEKGIHSDVGVDGRGVSHGMQKTVMNLRSLLRARTAPIVILDEPLAGLDENTRRSTGKLVQDLTRGKTVIIISHHPEIKKIVDRVFHIKPVEQE